MCDAQTVGTLLSKIRFEKQVVLFGVESSTAIERWMSNGGVDGDEDQRC